MPTNNNPTPQPAVERCEVCNWPLATRMEDGCVKGNCSQRPLPRRVALQPAGEGGAPDEARAAMEKFRRSVGFQFGFVMYSGLDVATAIDHICASTEVLLTTRATQPATAPSANLPCNEYEWGCANYSSDRSRWCDNCRAPATPTDVAERARRGVDKWYDEWYEARPYSMTEEELQSLADIIAAEFRGETK